MSVPPVRRLIRQVLPDQAGHELYKLRRLGPRRYVDYARIERRAARGPAPIAGRPYPLGGDLRPMVLHESTVPSVRSHWVESAQAIRELDAFKRLAQGARGLADIGAAEGIYSAAFCALTGSRAWAFEPSPTMLERLRCLLDVNDFDVSVHPHALGASSGRQPVTRMPDGQFAAAAATEEHHDMEVRALDDVFDGEDQLPDLVKLDVEGMELEVLRGGERTLRRSGAPLLLELHCTALAGGETAADAEALLRSLGLRIHSLDFEPIRDLSRFVEAEPEAVPGTTTVVCIP